MQETEIPPFSLYFGDNSFVKCFAHSETLKQLQSNYFRFHLAPIGQCKDSCIQLEPRCQKLSKFSTDRRSDRPTNLTLEAPSRSLKDNIPIPILYVLPIPDFQNFLKGHFNNIGLLLCHSHIGLRLRVRSSWG